MSLSKRLGIVVGNKIKVPSKKREVEIVTVGESSAEYVGKNKAKGSLILNLPTGVIYDLGSKYVRTPFYVPKKKTYSRSWL